MNTEHTLNQQPAISADRDARFYLDQLMALVGIDGLVAALSSPGLLAAVDQHATDIQHSLAAAGRPVNAASLAGYAKSVLAVAHRCGRTLPDPSTLNWARAEWYILRLVAVCSLADEADCF
jgi:Family of unknown function (DUF6401)